MSKHKFKVGDKVIGNEKAGQRYSMTKENWIGIVLEVNPDGHNGMIRVTPGGSYNDPEFTVRADCFDLYEPQKPEKIIIYRNGAEVVAKNTATGKTGIAKCSPEDTFDFNTGAKLAFDRLINPEPEKPKYFSGKIVCVSGSGSMGGFTKGKIYEVNNGKLIDDNGSRRPVGYRLKSVEEYNEKSVLKFLEIVE